MDYSIKLSSFEGPLDLLLNLINKAEVDIYDIPINIITDQYMDYIYSMKKLNLKVAGEFLLMASTLMEIKSKLLLPKNNLEDEEDEDPREELVKRLLEYKKYKDASLLLRKNEEYGLKAYYKPKEDLDLFYEDEDLEDLELDLDDLVKTINNILKNRKLTEKDLEFDEIVKDKYNVHDCTANIINRLESNKNLMFSELLSNEVSISEVVTYFLATLELIKIRIIGVKQNNDFSDLLIYNIEGDKDNE